MPLRIYRRRILKEILGASSLFVGFVAMLSVSVIGILIKLHAYTTGYCRRLHLGEPNQGELSFIDFALVMTEFGMRALSIWMKETER
ncbi:hypothetical protein MRB53_022412 [Persea americana]|uniref:Uncharacterized protein n=1 Tax=Persea americana TaxID=3435 RepID=A0ACC2L6M9_PERAE|nr:hypothetical protein MRB53_022412 [Persea americana]